MSIDAEHLASRLSAAINTGPAAGPAGWGWLWRVLLRELARGHPVTLDALTTASGRGVGEVRDGLAALSDTEYDQAGRVIGHGITLRPTPHQFTVDGTPLYTWCALDTLIFPTVLDRPATVVSPTPGTGELVALCVDPHTGISGLHPATAVVSVLIPPGSSGVGGAGVRSAFCNQVHFFATPDAAHDWTVTDPDGTVLPVAAAFELGRDLAQDLLTDPVEGTAADTPTSGAHLRHDVVTARPDDPIGGVRARVARSAHGFALVTTADAVLLGRLRGSSVAEADPAAMADEVMEPGPSTLRPHEPAPEVRGRLVERGLSYAIVTDPDGRLLGTVHPADLH